MNEPSQMQRKYVNRPVIIAICAIAWTVMVGAAAARYMVAQGYVDANALKQRAMQVKEFRHRVIDAERANREIRAEEGDVAPPDGIISKRLGLQMRKSRAEHLLPPADPVSTLDTKALDKEAEKAESKAASIDWLKGFLPYFSEGGLALLLGIGLGMISRTVLKVALVFGLLVIAGMEYASYRGAMTVDWGAIVGLIHETILNVTPNGDLAAIVKEKLPSLGALGGGYVMGLKG
jgi:uncharacterized membrane protein (Fun14 family)